MMLASPFDMVNKSAFLLFVELAPLSMARDVLKLFHREVRNVRNKAIIFTIIAVLFCIPGYIIYGFNKIDKFHERLNNIKITYDFKMEDSDHNKELLTIQVHGLLPETENSLNLFIDNRYLELINTKDINAQNPQVVYQGSIGGGPDHLFLLKGTDQVKLVLHLQTKNNPIQSPLISSYIESKIHPPLGHSYTETSATFTANIE